MSVIDNIILMQLETSAKLKEILEIFKGNKKMENKKKENEIVMIVKDNFILSFQNDEYKITITDNKTNQEVATEIQEIIDDIQNLN